MYTYRALVIDARPAIQQRRHTLIIAFVSSNGQWSLPLLYYSAHKQQTDNDGHNSSEACVYLPRHWRCAGRRPFAAAGALLRAYSPKPPYTLPSRPPIIVTSRQYNQTTRHCYISTTLTARH